MLDYDLKIMVLFLEVPLKLFMNFGCTYNCMCVCLCKLFRHLY